MSKSITVKSANNNTTTVTVTDEATIHQILGTTSVLTFFGRSLTDIEANLESINGQIIVAAFRDYMVKSSPNNGDVIGIGININTFGETASDTAATVVPGTVIVKWNGGINSVTLRGVAVGEDTVSTIISNPVVFARFQLDATQLSACDVSLQRGDDLSPVTVPQLSLTKVADKDIVWMQSRKADGKGTNA